VDEEPNVAAAVRAAAAGDQRPFTALVQRYIRTATLLATQLTGDADDADDIVQDAFTVVYTNAASFDESRPFAPWLYGIVRRLAQKRRIRTMRRARLLSIFGRSAERSSSANEQEHRLLQHIDVDLRSRDLWAAMQALPSMQRVCFDLVVMRQMAISEVAAMHDIAESTVRQHVFRARKALGRSVQREASDGAPGDIHDNSRDI
jgi:RNA polymerase sigma-70 factor, ECF subfamily